MTDEDPPPAPGPLQGPMRAAAARLRGQFEGMVRAHGGETGAGREAAFRDVLRSFLPDRLGVGTGIIIAADGAESPQLDVIVYDALYTPRFDRLNESVTLPVEGVYAVIEVASNLDRRKLEQDAQKILRVKRMRKSEGALIGGGGVTQIYSFHGRETRGYFPVLGFCFAYDGPSTTAIRETLVTLDETTEIHEGVDMVACLSQGVVANGTPMPRDEEVVYTAWSGAPRPDTERFSIPIDSEEQPGHALMLFYLLLAQPLLAAQTRPFSLLPYFEEGYA